jgi:hypothetical protein
LKRGTTITGKYLSDFLTFCDDIKESML